MPVTFGSVVTQASAGLETDEIQIGLNDHRPFIDWVGATVYLKGLGGGGVNAKAADGYYTIVDLSVAQSLITLKGTGVIPGYNTAVGIAPAGSRFVRLEDYYKVSQGGIPDFVTGVNAQSSWLPYLLSSTNTISQKIEPPGGVATIDGLTFSVQYKSADEELQYFLQRQPRSALSTSDSNLYITEDDTVINGTSMQLNAQPADQYITSSETAGELTFGGEPCMANGEAFAVDSYDAGTKVATIARGLLGTKNVWQSYGTLVSAGLPVAQGQVLEFYSIPSTSVCFDKGVLTGSVTVPGRSSLYFGLIDGIRFDNGITVFDIEVTSVLLKSRITPPAVGATTVDLIQARSTGLGTAFNDAAYAFFPKEQTGIVTTQRFKTLNWRWVALGSIALRVGLTRELTHLTLSAQRIPDLPGYAVTYPVQDVLQYYNDDLVGAYQIQRKADLCVIKKIDELRRFYRMTSFDDREASNNDYWIYWETNSRGTEYGKQYAVSDIIDGGINRTGARGTDLGQLQPVALCHIFEMAGGPDFGTGDISRNMLADTSIVWGLPENVATPDKPADYVYQPVIDVRDLILQILTSMSGKLDNPVTFRYYDAAGDLTSTVEQSFDVLPEGVGLGIPGDLIDTRGFLFMARPGEPLTRIGYSVTDLGLQMANVFVEATETAEILEWLKKKVLEPLGLALAQTSLGKLTVVNMVDDRNLGFPMIDDANLFIDGGNTVPEVPQEYNSTRLISSLKHIIRFPQIGNFDNLTMHTVPREFAVGEFAVDAPALTWGSSSLQRNGVNLSFDNLFTMKEKQVSDRAIALLRFFNAPASRIKVRLRDSNLYTTVLIQAEGTFGDFNLLERNVGSFVTVDLDNIVGKVGQRGGQAGGLITGIVREFNTGTSIVEILVLTAIPSVNYNKRWTASGEVASSTATVISLETDYYTAGTVLGDATGFEVLDKVVLLSANFVLKSLPQTILSVTTGEITLQSSFIKEDSSGPITASAGDIIIHATMNEQPAFPEVRAAELASFYEENSGEDFNTTRYEP